MESASAYFLISILDGLDPIVKLCKQLNEPRLLQALAKVVVSMVPPPEELLRLHKDESQALVEKLQAVVVLKKSNKHKNFSTKLFQ